MLLSQREELVAELTDYYEFLIDLYMPPETLKRPPLGGWPSITQERLAYLQKDDDVMEVLKHVPYICWEETYSSHQIYEKTVCLDYTGAFFERFGVKPQNALRTEPSEEEIDSCVATLARPDSSDGYWMFYHTARHSMQLKDYRDEEYREMGVKEFFRSLKEEFRQMSVIAVHPTRVYMVNRCDQDVMEDFQNILKRNGWPSQEFQRDKCIKELRAKDHERLT